MWQQAAKLIALIALIAGIGVGLYTFYGQTGTVCRATATLTAGGQAVVTPAPAPMECHATRLADRGQGPLAVAFLAVWSLAPALALAGSFGSHKLAVMLASVAFVIEFLAIVGSMSVGFLYFFLVMPLTGLALLTAVMPRGRRADA